MRVLRASQVVSLIEKKTPDFPYCDPQSERVIGTIAFTEEEIGVLTVFKDQAESHAP